MAHVFRCGAQSCARSSALLQSARQPEMPHFHINEDGNERNIPEDWIQGRPNNAECVIQMKTGHVMRVVGLDDPDALRAKGVSRTHTVVRRRQARARLPSARPRSVAREVGCDSAATAGQCPARSHVFREGYAAHRRQSHT